MLELLALAPEDGWAYVRAGDRIHLLRPPYTAASSSTVSESSVGIAVSQHGFLVPPEDRRHFSNLAAVIGWLNAEVQRSRQARGTPVPEDAAENLLEFAPPATLGEFLYRIDQELIPEARWTGRSISVRLTAAVSATNKVQLRRRT